MNPRLHMRVTIKYTHVDDLLCVIIVNLCDLKHNHVTMHNVRNREACTVTWDGRHGHLYVL